MMRLNSRQKEAHRAALGYVNSGIHPCPDSRQYARNCLVGLKPNWSTSSEPPEVSNTHYQERINQRSGARGARADCQRGVRSRLMDLRQFSYFIEVADRLSFTRAALTKGPTSSAPGEVCHNLRIRSSRLVRCRNRAPW
jgi:hypothetical protein